MNNPNQKYDVAIIGTGIAARRWRQYWRGRG
jgi:hypothetical protein